MGDAAGGETEGVYHAYVLATMLEPESRAYAVGVFTGLRGYFEIEGLVPGDYQLLVRAPTGLGTSQVFRRGDGAALELQQSMRAGPARVRAGEETGPLRLAGRRAHEVGMSPMEAVVSATRDSARSCWVDDQVGTLEAGKQADVLVVDGDPSRDIGALKNVVDVFQGGNRVDRRNLV